MGKRWMSWGLVAGMTCGAAGLAVGLTVGNVRASESVPDAERVSVIATTTSPSIAPSPSTSVAPPPSPSVAPSPSIAPSRPSRASGVFEVRRMQVTSAIENREPVDHPSAFDDTDERIYAFVEVSNPTDEPRELLVTFENGQRSTGHVTLEVPAHMPRYRTWAWTRLSRSPGEWTAEIRDENGGVVASDEFEVR